MCENNRLEVARLTPVGPGAVACVGVRGENAWALLRERWSRADGRPLGEEFDSWTDASSKRPYFGLFRFDELGGASDEVVLRRRTPDAFELCGHGGSIVTSRLVGYFAQRGARVVDGNAWESAVDDEEAALALGAPVVRSEFDAKLDALFYRAADELLVSATTERIARIALKQRALWRRFWDEVKREPETLRERVDRVLENAQWGGFLTRPIEVALLGVPNVGKSSLLNAALGYDRAVVSATSGTTRDLVETAMTLEGWNFRLTDAAGLRETSDLIEREGAMLAAKSALRADVTVVVYDCQKSRDEQDEEIARFFDDYSKDIASKCLLVLNKIDLPRENWHSCWNELAPEVVQVGAKHGLGVERFFTALAEKAFAKKIDDDADLALWNDEQIDWLKELRVNENAFA